MGRPGLGFRYQFREKLQVRALPRLSLAYKALRIDRSQGEVLQVIALKGRISGVQIDRLVRTTRRSGKQGRMPEGLVYKDLLLLKGTDTRGFPLVERVREQAHRKTVFYQLTEQGALAAFGIWGIKSSRLEQMTPWGELLRLSDRLDKRDFRDTFIYVMRRLARRMAVFTTTKHGPTWHDARLFAEELLHIMRLFHLKEDIGPEDMSFLRPKIQ